MTRYWLVIGLREELESGEGTSVLVTQPSFGSFDEAIESLADLDAPSVRGRVTDANAYVIRADTPEEAMSLGRAVFEQHETSPHVKLVDASLPTRPMAPKPPEREARPRVEPEIEALQHVHGELCITHQITDLALSHAPNGEYRDRLVHHQEAIEDLGYALRVMQAEMAGQAAPELPPRGRARLGYGSYHLGGSESATFTSALSSLATELSIAQHEARVAQNALPSRDHTLDELIAELGAFAATVGEHAVG